MGYEIVAKVIKRKAQRVKGIVCFLNEERHFGGDMQERLGRRCKAVGDSSLLPITIGIRSE